MGTFTDKTVILTGGASGIGKALCEELARRGAILIVADLDASPLEKTVGAIAKGGGKCRGVVLDTTDRAAVEKLVNDVVKEHGRLDYIFNNAGLGVSGEAYEYTYDDWKRTVDVDLYGVINGVFAAYPVMVKQGFGHIVNTASAAGLIPGPLEISYVAAKYGVVGLSNTLRIEGADLGVKVSVVCPGFIETPILYKSKVINMDADKLRAMAPKTMPPEQCALDILRGVEKNKAIIVVTFLAKLLWIVQRISPGFIRWIWKRQLREMRAARTVGR